MLKQKGNIGVIVAFIIVVVIIILGVFALMKFTNDKNQKSDFIPVTTDTKSNQTNNQEANNSTSKSMEPSKSARTLSNFTPLAKVSKLDKIDLVVGSGAEVKAGATVSVNYTGAVAATGTIFQSSKDFGTDPVTFPLNGVIKGWTEGIPGMKIGGTRRLVIPAEMAYGANPPANSGIPPNADLVFDVELVAIK